LKGIRASDSCEWLRRLYNKKAREALTSYG
jgi:hypothetical protein